jgi:hypothetical protein
MMEQRGALEQVFLTEQARYIRSQHSVRDREEKFDKAKTEVMTQTFWSEIEYLLHIMETLYYLLRAADSPRNPVIVFVYNLFLKLHEEWKSD